MRKTTGPLYRVSAAGGAFTPLTTLDRAKSEGTHRYPQFLPDGSRFIYFGRGPHRKTYLFTGLNRSKIGRFNKGLDKSPGFV